MPPSKILQGRKARKARRFVSGDKNPRLNASLLPVIAGSHYYHNLPICKTVSEALRKS